MKKLYIISCFAVAFLLSYSFAFSNIVVVSVKGDVAYKSGRQWKPLTKGMKLTEGTKISTGIRSSARISIDDNSLLVRQLTMMKIYRNKTIKKRRNTHIGLRYGSLNARVKRIKRLKTSFKITTPVATSSVRGTEQNDFYGSVSGMKIEVVDGTITGENQDGVHNIIYGRTVFRMGTNNSRPENPLSDVREKSIPGLLDKNTTTNDERGFQENWVGDYVGNSETPLHHLHKMAGTNSARAKLSFDWE